MIFPLGALTYGAGVVGIQPLIKVCPFCVFGGFIAGAAVAHVYPNRLVQIILILGYTGESVKYMEIR